MILRVSVKILRVRICVDVCACSSARRAVQKLALMRNVLFRVRKLWQQEGQQFRALFLVGQNPVVIFRVRGGGLGLGLSLRSED